MKIITCYKLVPEEQDIVVKSDRSLSFEKAAPKISQYDLNAVEAAMEIASAGGCTVTALSVGGKSLENSKARKDMLSRGPDSLSLVIDDKYDNMLPFETAKVLASTIKSMEFDLVLCGEGSGDLYAQQVGLLLGEMLGVASINAVSKITVKDGKVLAERTLEDEVELLEITLPAVVSVSTDINSPKIPTMKAILAAGKKPVNVISSDIMVDGVSKMQSVLAPVQADRKKIILDSDSDANIEVFAEHLRKILS